ncbi:MAG: hypothetical protein P8182_07300, partial [Deltaproteobacteria bacterium]
MNYSDPERTLSICIGLAVVLALVAFQPSPGRASDQFDIVSGVMESPRFKGKSPREKLDLAARLIRSNELKQSDLSFLLLDWADRYMREPSDPVERLRRWAELTNDVQLGHLRIPRDFLNRMLIAEYLVGQTPYLEVSPFEKMELLGNLDRKKLVDWSVFLAYARIYAGGIVVGANKYRRTTPLESLRILKTLKDKGLIGWHYRVPTEAILVAEDLAMDKDYQQGSWADRLAKLNELETKGLISRLTRKELEKLPAWRLLEGDPSFLKAGPAGKRKRLSQLKDRGLISSSTYTDLM